MQTKLTKYQRWYQKNKQRKIEYNSLWRAKNPDKVKAHRKKEYETSKRNPARKAVRKKWEEKNKEKMRAYQKEYHKKYKEKKLLANKKWKAENRDKVAAQEKRRYRRRSREKNLDWLKNRTYTKVTHGMAYADMVFSSKMVNYAN